MGTDEALLELSAPPPAPRVHTHPIFYMQPGTSVGERVSLHLFEPRYLLLLTRAMETDRSFIYCAEPPLHRAARATLNLGLDEEPALERCVTVLITSVRQRHDGTADIEGRGVKPILLREVVLEPGTGGLFSARATVTEPTDAPAAQAEAIASAPTTPLGELLTLSFVSSEWWASLVPQSPTRTRRPCAHTQSATTRSATASSLHDAAQGLGSDPFAPWLLVGALVCLGVGWRLRPQARESATPDGAARAAKVRTRGSGAQLVSMLLLPRIKRAGKRAADAKIAVHI